MLLGVVTVRWRDGGSGRGGRGRSGSFLSRRLRCYAAGKVKPPSPPGGMSPPLEAIERGDPEGWLVRVGRILED